MSIEIANESGVDVDESLLAGLARHVLDDMRVHPLAELSVLLVDEPAMTELHVRWMGEEGPDRRAGVPDGRAPAAAAGRRPTATTPPDPEARQALLGDVVICPQVATEQAAEAGHDVQDEIDLLCAHGILHLLGYDHAEPAEHATMFGLQDRLLASWRAARAEASGDGNPGGPAPGRPAPGGPAPGGPAPGHGGPEGPG